MSKNRYVGRRTGIWIVLCLTLLGLLAAGTSLASAIGLSGAPLPSSISLEQWETLPSPGWVNGNLGSSNSDYMESEVVPFRLDVGGVTAGLYTFSICRDYENAPAHGYDYLDDFDTSKPATPGGTISNTIGPISGVNVTITSVNEVGGQGACGTGQRETIVDITTTGAATAYVLWGGHLASPATWGAGGGAGGYPGASLSMQLLSPAKNRSINPSAIIDLAMITVQKVVDAGAALPASWCFNISPNPNNVPLPLCPAAGTDYVQFTGLPTGSYQVTETGPAGYDFVSGSGTNCTFSGSTATGVVTVARRPRQTPPVSSTTLFPA